MKIAIACGGTGGHIFPGLASAEVLKDRGHSVELWLSGRDVEKLSLSGWDGNVVAVKSSGFPAGLSLRWFSAGAKMVNAILCCRRIMKKNPPDIVLAMGGYASVGPILSGYMLGIPVCLHEANVIPGRAISFLSRFARIVAISFKETRSYLRRKSLVETGFPVRRGMLVRNAVRSPDVFTILVMGGSQGAHHLNEVVSEALILLKGRGMDFHVIHLSGRNDLDLLREKYDKSEVSSEVIAFLAEMNRAYAAADIAVCRSGAASCAELAVCGVPALFVPLPSSMRGHQLANAVAMARTGAADVMEESELTPDKLADFIHGYSKDAHKISNMRRAMKDRAMPDAAEKIADMLEQIGLS